MNRRRADVAVGILLAAILLGGGAMSWQAYQQQRSFAQTMPMMGSSMGSIHGPNPVWYVTGTLVAVGVVGGIYLVVRPDLGGPPPAHRETTADVPDQRSDDPAVAVDAPANDAIDPSSHSRARVLDLLPADERRILEPVLTSPGITQIELRDRSEFSKSKVSQTVSDLEQRGLLSRERQGRTYRVYPSDELREA